MRTVFDRKTGKLRPQHIVDDCLAPFAQRLQEATFNAGFDEHRLASDKLNRLYSDIDPDFVEVWFEMNRGAGTGRYFIEKVERVLRSIWESERDSPDDSKAYGVRVNAAIGLWQYVVDVIRSITPAMTTEEELQPPAQQTIAEVPGRLANSNDARDKWIYQQVQKATPYKTIATELKKLVASKGWSPINSHPGLKKAARRYARRIDAQPVQNRKKA